MDGTNAGLSYTWTYADKNSDHEDFTYKFDEFGCFPVDLSVRNIKGGQVNSMRAYVKVINQLDLFWNNLINSTNNSNVSVCFGSTINPGSVNVPIGTFETTFQKEPQKSIWAMNTKELGKIINDENIKIERHSGEATLIMYGEGDCNRKGIAILTPLKLNEDYIKVILTIDTSETSITLLPKIEEKNLINFSRGTFFRGINELLNKEILFKSKVTNQYFINVQYFYNGNRLVQMKQVILKKKEQVEQPDLLELLSEETNQS